MYVILKRTNVNKYHFLFKFISEQTNIIGKLFKKFDSFAALSEDFSILRT